jgi:hypothetical protein
MFFTILMIIEGTTEKVLQFILPLKSIYIKKTLFSINKMLFWTLKKGSNKEILIKMIYFYHKIIALFTFSQLPPIDLCLYYIRMCCSIQSQQDFNWFTEFTAEKTVNQRMWLLHNYSFFCKCIQQTGFYAYKLPQILWILARNPNPH